MTFLCIADRLMGEKPTIKIIYFVHEKPSLIVCQLRENSASVYRRSYDCESPRERTLNSICAVAPEFCKNVVLAHMKVYQVKLP